MHLRNVCIGLLASVVAACAAGPDYEAPAVEPDGEWVTRTPAGTPDLDAWWTHFEDPVLDQLVQQALAQNLDLKVALERIAIARAARDSAAAAFAPALDARASVTERRQSENGPLPIGQIPGIERDQTIYDLGFDASWELDLAGRTRRAVEAGDAATDAAILRAEGARVAVAAEVTRAYLELRGAQQRLAARSAAVAAARRTQELVDQRVEAGESARAELARAQVEVQTLEAGLPALESRSRVSALALALLLGEPPQAVQSLLATHVEPVPLEAIPVGERAALLRRRPDVLAAERELAAATAEIGVATAELFPRLVIGASGGFESLDTGTLFDAASETWSIMPRISWRLFDGGRVRAGIRGAQARARIAAFEYERTVLAALNDAEQALSRYALGLEALERQRDAQSAAERSYRFAEQRYRAGETALIELLDAERALRSVEDALAATHTGAAVDLVALYKALGGGFDPDTWTAVRR